MPYNLKKTKDNEGIIYYFNNFSKSDEPFELKLEIRFPYKNRTVVEYPEDCASCPVGFQFRRNKESRASCGRNKDWTVSGYDRPNTCKLHKLSVPEFMSLVHKTIDRMGVYLK